MGTGTEKKWGSRLFPSPAALLFVFWRRGYVTVTIDKNKSVRRNLCVSLDHKIARSRFRK